MNSLAQLRKFPQGSIILITDVVMETSCEANCNLQADECTVLAATKYERSTMSLAHLTRRRPGLTHAGNTPLQLLRCSSGQGAGPRVSSGMSLHVSG